MIATSFTIPTRFAAAFGAKILDGYLAETPIGEVLLSARKELINNNIPLGLFYTLQCPLDVLAPRKAKA